MVVFLAIHFCFDNEGFVKTDVSAKCVDYILMTALPIQSDVKAPSFEHPCIQAPLKTSHVLFLHLVSHSFRHPSEYLLGSQPNKSNNNRRSVLTV